MDSHSQTLLSIAALTLAVVVGFGIFLYNRKPESSPPPVLPSAEDSLQRTDQRAFVNFVNVIQAEDYDIGGPGVSFRFGKSESTAANDYRTDAVNIRPHSRRGHGFYLIFQPGDWAHYTVAVPTDGNYALKVSANAEGGSKFIVKLNGRSVTEIAIPKADRKGDGFVTAISKAFDVPAGQHTFQIEFAGRGEGRLDWFQGVRMKAIEPQAQAAATSVARIDSLVAGAEARIFSDKR